jgi:large subunit ribosomal protein L9
VHAASATLVFGDQAGAQYRVAAVCWASGVKGGHGFSRIALLIQTCESVAENILERELFMEVILKEDVAKLGSRGDVVKVAEGFGRNYLLPRKLAIEASAGNKAVIAQMKAASVRRSAKEKAQAEELAKQFDGLTVSFQRRSGEHDQLFGSVTSSDIGEALEKKGFNVDRRKVQLHEALRTLGEFTIPVKLHKDVTAHLKVVIEKDATE